jgi:hypothetical protein
MHFSLGLLLVFFNGEDYLNAHGVVKVAIDPSHFLLDVFLNGGGYIEVMTGNAQIHKKCLP